MHEGAEIEYESKWCQKYKRFDKNGPVWSCSYFKVYYKGKFSATILNSKFENGLSYKYIYYIKNVSDCNKKQKFTIKKYENS